MTSSHNVRVCNAKLFKPQQQTILYTDTTKPWDQTILHKPYNHVNHDIIPSCIYILPNLLIITSNHLVYVANILCLQQNHSNHTIKSSNHPVHTYKRNIKRKTQVFTVSLKGQSNEIFDCQFFSSFKPAWALTMGLNIFDFG